MNIKKRSRSRSVHLGPESAGVASAPLTRTFVALALLLIVVLGALVYANSLRGTFLWDDRHLIINNTFVKQGSHAGRLFFGNILAGAGKKTPTYRPLQMLTYMVDYRLWRLDPRGYHVTSVLWHLLASVCVFGFAWRLTADRMLGLFAGLLFVCHPVHTEAVSYISGRSDPLAAVFVLAAFMFYLDRHPRHRVVSAVLCALAYAAALLSREASLVLPVLVYLHHRVFREKVDAAKFVPLLGVTGLYFAVRLAVFKGFFTEVGNAMPLPARIAGFFAALPQYVGKVLWPRNLHMEYGLPRIPFTDMRVLLGIVLLSVLVLWAWRTAKRRPLVSFSLGWFLIALAPVSNLFPINAYMAEHWLYLPSVGIFLIAARLLSRLWARRSTRTAGLAGLAALLVASSVLTVRQNRHWSEPQVFYEWTLRHAPESQRALLNLANIYKSKGRLEEAVVFYEMLRKLNPRDVIATNNLGNIYRELGRSEEATTLYREALEHSDGYEMSFNNQGNIFEDKGQHAEAIAMYKKAIEANPQYAGSYYNLGNVCQNMGDSQGAVAWYEKAVEVDPDFAAAYNNLGNAYKKLGDLTKAMEAYQRAVELDPDFVDAYNNIGTVYFSLGRRAEAQTYLKKAVALQPDYPAAYVNLGVAAYDAKDFAAAVGYIDKAQALGGEVNPGFLKLLEPHRRE